MNFMGRRVVVTGGAGEIGLEIARVLQAGGAKIALIDRRSDALRAAAKSLDCCTFAVADVTDLESVEAAFEAIRDKMGLPDVLINNAGGSDIPNLDATDTSAWTADIDLNLNAAFYCFKAAVPDLLAATESCVVNIASVNGMGVFGHPAYSSAKAGLIHFTRNLAVEYGGRGLRANSVSPGTVSTRAWESRLSKQPSLMEDVAQWYPLGKVCRPKDIASVVAFLVSDGARMISGANVPVDGGLTAGIGQLAEAFTQNPYNKKRV